jgi:hypothetical protein
MKNVTRFVFVFLAACFLYSSLGSAAAQNRWRSEPRGSVEGSFDRTLAVSGPVDFEVSTGSGSIEIERGASNSVEIHGQIRAGDGWWRSTRDTEDAVRGLEANPPIEQSGQSIRVGRVTDRELERNVSISYRIVLPAQSNVRSHSGSGSQTVEGINGRIEVGTGSGSITLRDIKGDLEANTGSGSIQAMNVRGGLRMHTGSGRVLVHGEQTARWDVETGSGGIDLDLPPNAAFDLNAHTGSGGIDVAYPLTVQGRIDSNRHDVSGRVGSGGYPLNLRAGSGHIRIQ